MSASDEQLLYAKLNGETAQIPWKELQRYFASGLVIEVHEDLDLIEVASCVARDDTAAVSQWMNENRLGKLNDEQAQALLEADAQVWAVVVRPWILVQHRIVH